VTGLGSMEPVPPSTQRTASTEVARTQIARTERARALLVDATIASLGELGYRSTTTREVARRTGLSLGALAHHFPSRAELIATTLDVVGQRGVDELRNRATAAAGAKRSDSGPLVDVLWGFFTGELFTVWIKVWVAAAEDPALHAELVPINEQLDAAVSNVIELLAPEGMPARVWKRRMGVAMNALRGLALAETLEPRAMGGDPKRAAWSATRAELIRLLDG
jgi:AcrR family transcriptional regulator